VKNVCVFRKMFSLRDVGEQQPIREFNNNITRCFATDTLSDGCRRRVSFDNTLGTRECSYLLRVKRAHLWRPLQWQGAGMPLTLGAGTLEIKEYDCGQHAK
jgi:hypothetical protein